MRPRATNEEKLSSLIHPGYLSTLSRVVVREESRIPSALRLNNTKLRRVHPVGANQSAYCTSPYIVHVSNDGGTRDGQAVPLIGRINLDGPLAEHGSHQVPLKYTKCEGW